MTPEERALIYGPGKLGELDFRPYQHWMARKAAELPAVYLGAEPGLGKTAAALWAARQWVDKHGIKKILVIAPKQVALHTWPEEIEKWVFAEGFTYSLVLGTRAEREAALRKKADIYIVNRENFSWLYDHVGEGNFDFDALIYDEASRLKAGNMKTRPNKRKDGSVGPARRSAFHRLATIRPRFRRVLLLSGTPTPNGLIDLWGPMFILDRGQRLGRTKQAFLYRWFTRPPAFAKWTPRRGAFDDIMSRISDVFFTLKAEDYLDLPPLVEVDHWVTLPPAARKTYEKLRRDAILAEKNIEAPNPAVLAGKLLQYANGSAYDAEGNPIFFHDEKLKVLESIVEEASSPVLVFYSYQFDKDAILKRFPQCEVFGKDQTLKKRWDQGQVPMMLLHPASAGHGLNLQHGGHTMVWYGLPWSLELYQQALARLYRQGQTRKVIMHRILAKDTYDARVARVLTIKGGMQDKVMETLRAEVPGLDFSEAEEEEDLECV